MAFNTKLKSNFRSSEKKTVEHDDPPSHNSPVKASQDKPQLDAPGAVMGVITDETIAFKKDDAEGITSNATSSHCGLENDNALLECENNRGKDSSQLIDYGNVLTEDEKEELELMIDNALDQCFFCLYGLNLRSDSSYEDDIVAHKNSSRGDYQTKEQCADVFQYILPYAKDSSVSGLSFLFLLLIYLSIYVLDPAILA